MSNLSPHQTRLTSHLKGTEFWFDAVVLTLLWLATYFIPKELEIFAGISLISILKLAAIIASLQMIGFFAYHLAGKRMGLLIQGFLGGFVSSTMTYLQFTRQEELVNQDRWIITRALILATVAMLIECILIVASVANSHTLSIALPILIQLGVLLILLFVLPRHSRKTHQQSQQIVIDEPIIWKNVIYFAIFILGLIHLMRFLSHTVEMNYLLSTLIISLFEAHGVLAALITDLNSASPDISPRLAILTVLVGNVLSKTFFILRAKNPRLRLPIILSLTLSLALAFFSLFF